VSVPAPQLPLFRVTLFYGPEPAAGDPTCLVCVFNVKKRSWKGGVQIAVEVSTAQAARLQQALCFDAWIDGSLADVPAEEPPVYAGRAREVLMQEICSIKLTLALELEKQQDNTTLPVDAFVDELDRKVEGEADRIKSNILMELDISPR
jgi:hypothetical protein